MSKLKMAPLYAIPGESGKLYFCKVCLWTYPRDHEHFDFTVQSTLDVGL